MPLRLGRFFSLWEFLNQAPRWPRVGRRSEGRGTIPAAAVKPDVGQTWARRGKGGRTQSDERKRLLAIAERSQRAIENRVMADKKKQPDAQPDCFQILLPYFSMMFVAT